MILTLISVAALASHLPDYKSELLARTNGSSTYNLPAFSAINNTSPSINDQGDVVFKILSAGIDQHTDHSQQSAIWLKGSHEVNGGIVYFAKADKMIGDPEMLKNGDVLFTLFDEVSSDGLFIFEPKSKIDKNIFAAKNMAALGYAQVSNGSSLSFRATNSENKRSFFEWQNGQLSKIVDEELPYSYLFGPSVNMHSQWLFKVRVSEKFDISDESADQIVLLNPEFNALGEKFYHKTVIAEDSNANVLSPYASFDNSPMISNAGFAVFTATLKNRTRVVVAVNGEKKHFVVAQEKTNGVSQIESFSPK